MVNSYEEWADLYKKLVYWELQLEEIEDSGMVEILESQKVRPIINFANLLKRTMKTG